MTPAPQSNVLAKPSPEWYTPEDIWTRVNNTLGGDAFDPCPIGGAGGFQIDWCEHKLLYVNPPTPAAPWAIKAIDTITSCPSISILFAGFSEPVMWQVNQLMDFPVCWVRYRIRWIDGRIGKRSTSPRNYNTFAMLTHDQSTIKRFVSNFRSLGDIRRTTTLY